MFDPGGELLPGGLHDFGLLREVGEPEALDGGGFGVHGAEVELGWFAGGGAVLNNASEIAEAAQAFGGVFAAEHFEDGVDAFAVGEIFNDFFVVVLLVVDGVLEAEGFYPG